MLRRSINLSSSISKESIEPGNKKDNNHDDDITMKLGNNTIMLKDNGEWLIKSSDLDEATVEMTKLIEDKEQLTAALHECVNQIDNLKEEIVEINNMKSVILEMLMNERQQRMKLEKEKEGYKEELRESFRVIVELKKLIKPETDGDNLSHHEENNSIM